MNVNKFFVVAGVLFLFACSLCFVFVSDVWSKFYKYTDENGVVHFVDEPGKIPDQFSNQAESYKEKKDYLTPGQIKALEEKQTAAERERVRRIRLQEVNEWGQTLFID